MDAGIIPKGYLKRVWPLVLSKIEKACEYSCGTVTPETVYKGVMAEDFQLWVSDDSKMVAVTQVSDYDDGSRYLTWILLSGEDLEKYMQLKVIVDDWAKKLGCKGDELLGRPGWARVLKGYKEIYRFLRQDYVT